MPPVSWRSRVRDAKDAITARSYPRHQRRGLKRRVAAEHERFAKQCSRALNGRRRVGGGHRGSERAQGGIHVKVGETARSGRDSGARADPAQTPFSPGQSIRPSAPDPGARCSSLRGVSIEPRTRSQTRRKAEVRPDEQTWLLPLRESVPSGAVARRFVGRPAERSRAPSGPPAHWIGSGNHRVGRIWGSPGTTTRVGDARRR